MKDIKIHPIYSDYACSDQGEIFSLKYGKIKTIKSFDNLRGYLFFNLFHNGKHINKMIHQFVYECFTQSVPVWGNTSDSNTINHKDSNKHNNTFQNLEIISMRENIHLRNCNKLENKTFKLPKGVTFRKNRKNLKKPYQVVIWFNKKSTAFGSYPTIEAAYEVSKAKFKELFNEELPEYNP